MKCSTRAFGAEWLTRCRDGPEVFYTVEREEPPPSRPRPPLATMKLRHRRTEKVTTVEHIEVHGGVRGQRRGLGTRLYEEALAEACRERRQLASDDVRSPFAEAFWRKQQAKGRAVCDSSHGKGQGGYYSGPLVELIDDRDNGHISEAEYDRIRAALPKPEKDVDGPFWVCPRYKVRTPCRTAKGGLGRIR